MTRFDDQERCNRLRLARSAYVGPMTFRHLLARFETAGEALRALPQLARRGGLKAKIRLFSDAQAHEEIARTEKMAASIVFWGEEDYPANLFVLTDAPPLITILGHAHLLCKEGLSIVGTRNASANGMRFTARLAASCGEAGYVVVSGMARGIDTAANSAALKSGSVAVLAGGVDHIYPYENRGLYRKLAEDGAVVSEMGLGFVPTARHFPRRNRIIAGLTAGTLIVEAPSRSGAMITARYALEQGRDVFAVPGSPQDERSAGPNALLRDGAYLVEKADDVLAVLNKSKALKDVFQTRNRRQQALALEAENLTQRDFSERDIDKLRDGIFSLLGFEATPIDDLIRLLDSDAARINAALLEMELAGRIERAAGNCVMRCG